MASAAPSHRMLLPWTHEEKSLFRIGEVSRLTATKTFVLRYWETEFPMLEPVKSPSGHRLYRREDIETVFEIKRLLYEEGFTIAGARKYLEGHGEDHEWWLSRSRAVSGGQSLPPKLTPQRLVASHRRANNANSSSICTKSCSLS